MTLKKVEIQELPLWERLAARRIPASFDLEITARCNNCCRHCYINLPADDRAAAQAELAAAQIIDLARQAVDLGALWCLVTGGEPLLRSDFAEIYLGLKRAGLLVTVFTNACLLKEEHVSLFRDYPPRDIEVTVYGVSEKTYEAVTQRKGSWRAFRRGLTLLLEGDVPVRLKAVAVRSNLHEFDQISKFCREFSKDFYHFDPLLRLRLDGDRQRNRDILSERLSPEEIVLLEKSDPDRVEALRQACVKRGLDVSYPLPRSTSAGPTDPQPLFRCGAGQNSFAIGYDGTFRLCSGLCHPGTTYDLKAGSLREAWEHFVPKVLALKSAAPWFLEKCARCEIADLCLWCPAQASVEAGSLDAWLPYLCKVAHARAGMLREDQEQG